MTRVGAPVAVTAPRPSTSSRRDGSAGRLDPGPARPRPRAGCGERGWSVAGDGGVVQVLGDGHVNASGEIDCGQGSKHCYFSSSTSASVTLTAAIGFASWNGSADCNGTTESCTFTLDPGDDDEEVANSTPTPPTTLTVAVTGDASNAGGKVTGGGLECDPGEIDCSLNVYTGSTLTMVAEPSDGYDFTGWGGACSGTDVFCTVQMSAAQTVNASFGPGSHTLRLVAADPYGRVRTLTWVVVLAT